MSIFIATMVILELEFGIESARKKYREYFVDTDLYKSWQSEADEYLKQNGYEDCIVIE